jgi:hypothetical protein
MGKKKSAADFEHCSAAARDLYAFLTSIAGRLSFGLRGASFRLKGKPGKPHVLVRLELKGSPSMVPILEDTLWVSLEVAATQLPTDLCKRLKDCLQTISRGEVNLHVSLASLSERQLKEIQVVLSQCFGAD